MRAAAFMASLSSAGREIAPAAAATNTRPNTVVERWNGYKFIEVKLTWNGTNYEESK